MLQRSTNPILKPRHQVRAGIQQDLKLVRTSIKRQTTHLLHVANAAKHIEQLPGSGESLHGIMRGNYNAWDFVPAVLQLASPVTIDHLFVATLGFNKANAGELMLLLDSGKIRSCTFICSCYFRDTSSDIYQPLAAGLLERRQKVAAVRSHAKLLGFAMSDGRHFLIESSANLRSCRNIEQFALHADRDLYEFHKGWIDSLFAAWPDGIQPNDPPTVRQKRKRA